MLVLSLRILGFALILVAGAGLAGLSFAEGGGIVGSLIETVMTKAFNSVGAGLILLALFFIGVTLFTGLSWSQGSEQIGAWTLSFVRWLWLKVSDRKPRRVLKMNEVKVESQPQPQPQVPKPVPPQAPPAVKKFSIAEDIRQAPHYAQSSSELPSLSLLDAHLQQKKCTLSQQELELMSRRVEANFADFGVSVQVVDVHPGPVVTRFELRLAAGTKVSKISNLSKDLARSLSVVSVRVVEVIPGKSVIGLELPNEQPRNGVFARSVGIKAYAQFPFTVEFGVR